MNDNCPLPVQAIETPAFETKNDHYALFADGWQPLSLLDDAAAREWQRLPRWARAQFENLIARPYTLLADKPAIETLDYVPERGEGCGQLVTASWQPHHRESAEQAHILYFDGALAPAEEWWLPETTLRRLPIILARPGEHLMAARTAVELALEGERCAWVDVGNDILAWRKRLSRFELILPRRIYQ